MHWIYWSSADDALVETKKTLRRTIRMMGQLKAENAELRNKLAIEIQINESLSDIIC